VLNREALIGATHYSFLMPSLILNDDPRFGEDDYSNMHNLAASLIYIEPSNVYSIKYNQVDVNAKFF